MTLVAPAPEWQIKWRVPRYEPNHLRRMLCHALDMARWSFRPRHTDGGVRMIAWSERKPKTWTMLDRLVTGLRALAQTAIHIFVGSGLMTLLYGVAPLSPNWESPTIENGQRIACISKAGNDGTAVSSTSLATAQANPFLTIAAARTELQTYDGTACRMLFKRGDTWTSEAIAAGSFLSGAGSGVDQRVYIGAYGTGAYPKVYYSQIAFGANSYIFVDGLDFQDPAADGAGWTSPWCSIGNGESHLTLQDCSLGLGGISAQDGADMTIRGCRMQESWIDIDGTPTVNPAIYAENFANLTIEWCYFDKLAVLPGDQANQGGRGIYLNYDVTGLVVRYNVFSRDGNEALLARSVGQVYGNVSLRSRKGFAFGYPPFVPDVDGSVVRQNLVMYATNAPSNASGSGITFSTMNGEVLLEDNVICHQEFNNVATGIYVGTGADGSVVCDGNIIYDWVSTSSADFDNLGFRADDYGPGTSWLNGTIVATKGWLVNDDYGIGAEVAWGPGDRYYNPSSTPLFRKGSIYNNTDWVAASGDTGATFTDPGFPDPERDLVTYCEDVLSEAPANVEEALDILAAGAMANTRAVWDEDYSAVGINNYVRAGFNKTAVT